MTYEVETYREKTQWLTKRGLGGSDCATILGLNRWMTPLELWAQRTGRIQPLDEPSVVMRTGLQLEPLALRLLAEETGVNLWRPGERKDEVVQLRSTPRPWQTYTPDALIVSGDRSRWDDVVGLVEAKFVSAHNSATWEERSSEGALRAEAQLQHGFAVTDQDGGFIAALIGGTDFRFYEVERDDDVVDYILERESEFLEHVTRDIPPEAEFTKKTERALADLLPYLANTEVTLDRDDDLITFQQMKTAHEAAKRLYKEYDDIRAHLKYRAIEESGLENLASHNPKEPLRITVPGVGVWSWKRVDVKGYTVAPKQRDDFREVNR